METPGGGIVIMGGGPEEIKLQEGLYYVRMQIGKLYHHSCKRIGIDYY